MCVSEMRGHDPASHSHATLRSSCFAKDQMSLQGNGWNSLSLRKSKTLCPSSSDTMQTWLRYVNVSMRWMHLLRTALVSPCCPRPALPRLYSLVVAGIIVSKCLEDTDLNLRCIRVLLDRPNDLDGHLSIPQGVFAPNHLAECALTQQAFDSV